MNDVPWDKYTDQVPKVILFVIFLGVAKVVDSFHGMEHDTVRTILIITGIVTVIWMCFDFISKWNADLSVMMSFWHTMDRHDRLVQVKMFEGLQNIRFIDEYSDDDADMQVRINTNNVAVNALIPSIFQNHHCEEMAKHGDVHTYLESKIALVVSAFKRHRHTRSYMHNVKSRLSPNVSFEDVVSSYVYQLFKESHIPALVYSCNQKLEMFRQVEQRGDISRRLRRHVVKCREEIESHLSMLFLSKDSDIVITKSGIIRDVGQEQLAVHD